MVDHVVWDWNGTLLADVHAVVDASAAGLAAVGVDARLDLERYRSTFRRPLRTFYADLVGRDVGEDEWVRLNAVFGAHYRYVEPALSLAAGATDALERFADAGFGQSVLSMLAHDVLHATLGRRGLHDWFARVDGDHHHDGRSKAAALAEHLEVLRLDPAGVVLVGDTLDDAAATAAVGCACVLVAEHSTHHAADLRTAAPVVATLPEAVEHVLALR
ncbi:HAD family hydrolase [Actinomycetospora cinnamomea]|uniref:Phosphoglycolate phosphatase-like HAD superfamily hydrolase n=1 Tax=Actinomycetospora cinnamomea TaxID=663609 RepID=A0A2U1E8U2_9PSEU|nr:HAD family hydrolase [Actinomycetospora cinnamomea]PVY96330.1 phosphoglycolate phosphatase-like HAD superfamily hydrolase [Actinomycetospora cinnamomea]